MGLFVVTVRGEGLRVTFDGAEILCGFFKNEFIRAKTAKEAEAKARTYVVTALQMKKTINQDDLGNLALSIESIKPVRLAVSWFRRQGFVFHPVENASTSH
jgi:hypothetical protein